MKTQATQAAASYFNSVLYNARVFINEVKLIDVKKGAKYCAVNASIVEIDAEGGKSYQTIDLIVRGEEAKKILWEHKEKWPVDRTKREGDYWIADINIGSIRVETFPKRDGTTGCALKGRLLKINNLKIGEELVLGELSEAPSSIYVATCNINEINPEKGLMKISALDGKMDAPERFGITLQIGDNPEIAEMLSLGICPKGYKHRETNPKVFAILEIADLSADFYTKKDGTDVGLGVGKLVGVRYLKADDDVLISGKKIAA